MHAHVQKGHPPVGSDFDEASLISLTSVEAGWRQRDLQCSIQTKQEAHSVANFRSQLLHL